MRNFKQSLTFGLALCLLVPTSNAQANGWHNTAAIDRSVAEFTGAAAGTTGGARRAVDQRVRLKSCQGPLSLTWRNSRQDTVLVECPDLGGWRMFVPVLRQQAVRTAAVASKPQVKRGQAITIAVRGRGFAVSQPGEVLENGRVGEWIRVKPRSGKETLKAKIVDPGMVEVTLR